MKGVYASRYKHHIFRLMDGLIKLRSLVERDAMFTAKEIDHEVLTEIWQRMLLGWCQGIANERYEFGKQQGRSVLRRK